MRTTLLLAHLAVQTVLNVTGAMPAQRMCRDEARGKLFWVKHGAQHHCNEQHANRQRLRKYRRGGLEKAGKHA
jgi:hypothetical protein